MTNTEKIERLKNLIFKIENLGISESSIKKLSLLIKNEHQIEISNENPSKIYSNNLKQTIENQLDNLEHNSSKPKLRIPLFEDCVSNFKQDIERELEDLKYR